MSLRSHLSLALELLAIVAIVALVAGQVLGQPVLLSYATSGSMEPTIDAGDGYVVVPAGVAGPIEEGDVVVFRATELHGGGLTVHRVVGETDRGFVTKGDANPFTDQSGEEPPVKRAQVVGVALRVGGSVVTVPELGTAVTGTQSALATAQRELAVGLGTRSLLGTRGIAYLVFAASVLLYVGDLLVGGDRDRKRDRTREREAGVDPRLVVGALALVLVAAATAAMVLPAGPYEFGTVSAESDSPGTRVIPTGETETTTYRVPNGGLVPVYVRLEAPGERLAVEPGELTVGARSVANASVAVTAPPETGYYRSYLIEHRYLAVLPPDALRGLYAVHPWAPIVVIDGLLGGSFYLLGVALVGTGRLRRRERDRDLPVGLRVRRAVRRLYGS
jgi:signal peptidase